MESQVHEHPHTQEAPPEFVSAAEACWAEVQAVCARYGLRLHAEIQLGEGNVLRPVLQLTTAGKAEDHGHSHN
jgi:hypothetical protein